MILKTVCFQAVYRNGLECHFLRIVCGVTRASGNGEIRSIERRNTTKEDLHLRNSILHRGLSALSNMTKAPSLRFKKMFIMVATKLSESPVYTAFFRDKVVTRMRGELNRFRQTEVDKGHLLSVLATEP